MEKPSIILSAVFVLAISACNNSFSEKAENGATTSEKAEADPVKIIPFDTTKLQWGESFYQCAFDPQVMSDKPDPCPICKVPLVKTFKMR